MVDHRATSHKFCLPIEEDIDAAMTARSATPSHRQPDLLDAEEWAEPSTIARTHDFTSLNQKTHETCTCTKQVKLSATYVDEQAGIASLFLYIHCTIVLHKHVYSVPRVWGCSTHQLLIPLYFQTTLSPPLSWILPMWSEIRSPLVKSALELDNQLNITKNLENIMTIDYTWMVAVVISKRKCVYPLQFIQLALLTQEVSLSNSGPPCWCSKEEPLTSKRHVLDVDKTSKSQLEWSGARLAGNFWSTGLASDGWSTGLGLWSAWCSRL